MAVFTSDLSELISRGLKANPFTFATRPVPAQQGLRYGLQNLEQALGAAEGIPAMPSFSGSLAPGFDFQNLFQKSRTPGATPIPTRSGGTTPVVHASDEEYKRLKSQYGGPAGVEQLAMQTTLPTGFTPGGAKGPASLKDFYSAESQVGRRDMGSTVKDDTGVIIPTLTKGLQGQAAKDMETWARANPMLAQREYAKKFSAEQAAAGYAGTGPSDEAIRAAMTGGKYFPSAGGPSPIAGQTSFGTIANPVPPTQVLNQGAMVDAGRGKENLVPQQAAKTTPEGQMPALPTTLDKVGNFVYQVTPLARAIVGPGGLGGNFGF